MVVYIYIYIVGDESLNPLAAEHLQKAPHLIRTQARRWTWFQAERDRRSTFGDAAGISVGIDRTATLALYNALRSEQQRGALRYILCGAFFAPKDEAGKCIHCGSDDTGADHVWFHCHRWQEERNRYATHGMPFLDWSAASRCLGLCLDTDPRPRRIVHAQALMIAIFMQILRNAGVTVSPSASIVDDEIISNAIATIPVP